MAHDSALRGPGSSRLSLALLLGLLGCDRPAPTERSDASAAADSVTRESLEVAAASAPHAPAFAMSERALVNRYAYIPPQCYTRTRSEAGRVVNPCYVCHASPVAPNFIDDAALQLRLSLPPAAAHNRWDNLFAPAILRTGDVSDAALRSYVRTDNYLDQTGAPSLPVRLAQLPAAWDADGDARWEGYVPDAFYRFDTQGFDLAQDGTPSGWRAYAYAPLPGAFFPSNGSAGDVLIRLAPALREDGAGHADQVVTLLNLAVVEALITRRAVPIQPTREAQWGVDLDADGKLGTARRVVPHATRTQYVGRARLLQQTGELPLELGLFPLGTELLHGLRYLDVSESGVVTAAARRKELRYAKKVRWLGPADLRARARAEELANLESGGAPHTVLWQGDRGVYNGQGWLFAGFLEAADGTLRPETYEESVACVGCHGGLGVTTDSTFSFARKRSQPAGGWFDNLSRRDEALPDVRRADGSGEYATYLAQNRAGDELRENGELRRRFFDARGRPRRAAERALRSDVRELLWPSPERAWSLNRAYLAVVREQSFTRGRDAVLAPSRHVHRDAPVDAPTGIVHALAPDLATLRAHAQ